MEKMEFELGLGDYDEFQLSEKKQKKGGREAYQIETTISEIYMCVCVCVCVCKPLFSNTEGSSPTKAQNVFLKFVVLTMVILSGLLSDANIS